ncbi:MAG: glucoamylase family protein [Gammaproteobacteria bacterium]|nr:glucoamylase family protein [Gammaproteobacteria bacterium]
MAKAGQGKTGHKRPGTQSADDRANPYASIAGRHARILPTRTTLLPSVDLKALMQRFDRLYDRISADARSGQAGTRPEEWLLDNRHVIAQSLEDIRKDLPTAYLNQLPRVSADDEQGHETIRVKDLARLLLRKETQPIEVASLERAVERYQAVTVLTIGELWALPAMLRLSTLDHLADSAEACLEMAETLRGSTAPAEAIIDEVRADEVAGYIISLRHLDTHDWRETFERLCRVERILRRDPSAAYARMDFDTRDRYRGAVEEVSRATHRSEVEVAECAVGLCRRHDPDDHRTWHIGYYLVADGRPALESALGFELSPSRRVFRRLMRHPTLIYFSLLLSMSLSPLAVLGAYLLWQGAPPFEAAGVVMLAAIPSTGLAVAMLNGLLTWWLAPRRLPKLNFEKGIPAEHRTAVVMPVIFGGPEDVDHAMVNIEINYLNNQDGQLAYAILSDWSDAPQESMPDDAALLDRAASAVRTLNERYGREPERGPFLLLHRKRLWNEAAGCWMGWERKRGKLAELNRLLGGDNQTSYSTRIGDPDALAGVEFVVTLDADTRMPPGAARRLVGTMAHPLNRAVIDRRLGAVKAGYSILQPRLEIDPESTQDTRFTEVFAGDTTLDLYTHATSDVYHDLFGEGIYAGKGIYDWRAFQHTLVHRIPDNALLSHDLLEGIHGRVGLVSDIVLLEQYPANALAYMRRLHRWVRGDWQLLPWLAPFVPSTTGRWIRNPLSAVHQWKILDNLRRSVQPAAVLALLFMAWFGLIPGPVWLWTVVFAALMAAPLVAEVFNIAGRGLVRPSTLMQWLRYAPRILRDRFEHWALSVVLLPFESFVVLDAVGRTLFRLFVTKRRLLEWTSAAHTQRRLGAANRPAAIWREMWVSPALAVAGAGGLYVLNPASLYPASILLLAWLAAPQIIWWVNRPLDEPPPPLTAAERRYLRRVARRTWQFFEQFMGPDNHWLPPDNYQEEPRPAVARRTSPTNIGMALLASLCAYDLGYIDVASLTDRIRNTFDGMAGLARFRGHWLNWYETRELHALQPQYVSTVDSGNLAACLIVLARALDEMAGTPVHRLRITRGMADTVAVLSDTLDQSQPESRARPAALLARLSIIRRRLLGARNAETQWQCLAGLELELSEFTDELAGRAESGDLVLAREQLSQIRTWLDELRREYRQGLRFLQTYQPWLAAFAEPPAAYAKAAADSLPGRRYKALKNALAGDIPLDELPERCRKAVPLLYELEEGTLVDVPGDQGEQAREWAGELRAALEEAAASAERLTAEMGELGRLADRWVEEMDFGFLYDEHRALFRIGYNATAGHLDPNYYDLMASEARLSSFVAIAKGDIPSKHWLHLGRPFRRSGGTTVLMSWGATLFEYLMPHLFMTAPFDSMMNKACRSAIVLHQDFARRHGLPWGISESGYYRLDEEQHYQYRAFGVPGLGLRRDLGDRLVVSPYSSLMALPFEPAMVMRNLRELEACRGLGFYGFHEAVDFGRAEKTVPRRARVVRSYMSHHQGMAIAAIDNLLNSDVMVRRFHADHRVARVSMLLHEEMPRDPPTLKVLGPSGTTRYFAPRPRVGTWPLPADADARRRRHVLSNGHYTLVLDSAGGGCSSWDGIALTRSGFGAAGDVPGQWVYVKDLDDESLLSIGRDPVGPQAGPCTVQVGPHVASYQRRGRELLCQMDIALSSQHDIEARRIVIRNESDRSRRILVAAYAELAMSPPGDFLRHPAFARLFVESECLESESMLLYRRRPRSSLEKPLYLAHTVLAQPGTGYRFAWETDRMRFIGRGGHAGDPAILKGGLEAFSGTAGPVLDPVIGSAVEAEIEPFGTFEMAYLTAVGKSRSELLTTLRSYRSMPRVEWIFEQSRMQSEQELSNLRIDPGDVPVMMDVASAALSPRRALRVPDRTVGQPLQSVLWSRGISGDRPVMLVRVRDKSDSALVEEIVKTHTFLCARSIAVDLVLVDEESTGYAQPARDRLEQVISTVRARTHRRLTGSVFVVAGRELAPEILNGLAQVAHLVLDTAGGPVSGQLARRSEVPGVLPPFVPVKSGQWRALPVPSLPRPGNLLYDNGIGGFETSSGDYIVHLEPGSTTPAPWCNVIANPRFGCLLTESGSACTWAGNSSEWRLTPWPNDPVGDRSGEVVYLRDEETGRVWTPTVRPMPDGNAYQIRYGAGYTEYRHHSSGLAELCTVHVDRDAPVKLCRLALTNTGTWTRRITVTYYAEWVLGTSRADTIAHIRTGFDPDTGALTAWNAFDRLAGKAVAFLVASGEPHGVTADRAEFLGLDSDTHAPAALYRMGLSGEVEHCDEPCAATQLHVDLPPGETRTVHFVLGQGVDEAEALALARHFQDGEHAAASFERVRAQWQGVLGAVQVHTPDPAMDLLLNRWLLYQVLASRLWGRTGYYQASGAYGFRDQLQDVMALTWTSPMLAREHLLRAAGRQFQDGDVLHWWHESPVRGIRTRCSDDLLWLPFVTAHYMSCTGDNSILHESVAYLDGSPLQREETERYAEYGQSSESGSLFEHCCRAIDRAATVGPHGLPTIGSGDWNDGFNRVSTTGSGESVWLAWFMVRVCLDFAPLCEDHGDPSLARHYRALAGDLRQKVDREAWDGEWYRRAYYDDGTPLGSAANDECRIDLIAQTWSVMSGDEPTDRARRAMESAWDKLVDVDERLVLLLAPPFDRGAKDPGYIKGYPPGIRENGGQYTHAATWAVWAAAGLGDGERAMALFRLLNPVLRSADPDDAVHYRVEPYVLSGDVYGVSPHAGRGGWTWYSGAAAWLYRAGVEALLGLRRRGDQVEMAPCLPPEWKGYEASLTRGRSRYKVNVRQARGTVQGEVSLVFDGEKLSGRRFPFVDDGHEHRVDVEVIAAGPGEGHDTG